MRSKTWGLLGITVCAALVASGCAHGDETGEANGSEQVGSSRQAIASSIGTTLVYSNFGQDSAGFTYADDGFRSTNAPAYASGSYSDSSRALSVDLGGIDGASVLGMSGGWGKTVSIAQSSRLILSFDYELAQTPNYESDERSEVVVSIDGQLRGVSGKDYVARIVGDGEGGPDVTTGKVSVDVDLGVVSAGSHTLKIGAYNNKKTAANESTHLTVDNVRLGASPSAAPAAMSCDTAACCPAGTTVVNGTSGSDVWTNTSNNRCLVLQGGSDVLANYATGAAILGGDGDDTIMAGTGSSVRGGPGRDTINGFSSGTIYGGPGDDTIMGANGDSFVYPGAGTDTVATGTGNDTVVIYDLCEVAAGEQLDGGSGFDTLVTPVPLDQLRALGVNVSNFEHIVVQQNSCKSECVTNACSGNGQCVEGSSAGKVKCDCLPGYSGADCSVLGEPTVPVQYDPTSGKPIAGYPAECKNSSLVLVNADNPAIDVDPLHPERRRLVYAAAAPGCEATFCTLASDGSETQIANPTEAELNAAPPTTSTCPARPATLPAKCSVVAKTVQAATCTNDVDCQAGFVCSRVCEDESCKKSSKHCGQLSASCAGMPAEPASCDDKGYRMCSDQGPKRSSTQAEVQPEVITDPAPVAKKHDVPDALAKLTDINGCGGLQENKLEQNDPWTQKDDGSSLFGIYFTPSLKHHANFTPTNLGELADFGVSAEAGFKTGVKIFGKAYDAIAADAHVDMGPCQRSVGATFTVFGDEIVGVDGSVNGGDPDTFCKQLSSDWEAMRPVLEAANQAAHEARALYTGSGPTHNMCDRVKQQLQNQEQQPPGTPLPVNAFLAPFKSTDLDCDANLDASATLATNAMIDTYKAKQAEYLNKYSAFVAARAHFTGGDTLPISSDSPFAIAGYSQTFFIGPIPVTIDARIFGEYGAGGAIGYSYQLSDTPSIGGTAGIGPHFDLRASVFAGVGIPAASIGVEGDLLLLHVEPSFNVGMTLQGQKVADTRPLDDWTGDLLPGFPRKIAKFKTPWTYGASLGVQTLDGHFDAVARLKLFFFTKTFRKQIFSWKGPGFNIDLTNGGDKSPTTPAPGGDDFGGFGDALAFTGVNNITLADIPTDVTKLNPNKGFEGRIPGESCSPIVK